MLSTCRISRCQKRQGLVGLICVSWAIVPIASINFGIIIGLIIVYGLIIIRLFKGVFTISWEKATVLKLVCNTAVNVGIFGHKNWA